MLDAVATAAAAAAVVLVAAAAVTGAASLQSTLDEALRLSPLILTISRCRKSVDQQSKPNLQ